MKADLFLSRDCGKKGLDKYFLEAFMYSLRELILLLFNDFYYPLPYRLIGSTASSSFNKVS